jgi:hypothetical protein
MLSNLAGLSVGERLGDNLKVVLVNHVSHPRLG